MSKEPLSEPIINPPAWLKQVIAVVSIIAVSIGGAVGVQRNTTPAVNNSPTIAPALEEVQKAQADMAARITTLERQSDKQSLNVDQVIATLTQLVEETRANSAQVQRMAGTLEQLTK